MNKKLDKFIDKLSLLIIILGFLCILVNVIYAFIVGKFPF